MQGAGACQTQLAMGDVLFNVFEYPGFFPRPYVGDDNHSRAALNERMLCFSRLCGTLSAGWDGDRQKGKSKGNQIAVSKHGELLPGGTYRQPRGETGGKLGGDLVLQFKRGIKAQLKLARFCH